MAVEYTFENTPASATASESDFPSRTRSRIWVMTGRSLGEEERVARRSRDFKIGKPALMRVLNCWLRMRNSEPPIWRPLFWRTSPARRSEEHTSELQSRSDLVCRLLLEK